MGILFSLYAARISFIISVTDLNGGDKTAADLMLLSNNSKLFASM